MKQRFSETRVLIAEDEEASRLVLCGMLADIGVKHCIATENGREALQCFRESQIDLVITDWNMQPMDGLALTWAIRKVRNGQRAKTPIIMLTGYADQNAVLNARQLGISQFLAKPASPAELASRMHLALSEPVTFVQRNDIFIAKISCIPAPPPPQPAGDARQVWKI